VNPARLNLVRPAVAAGVLTGWMVLCDHLFHVATGTVVHFWHPQIDGQTVWVVVSFGLGGIAFVTAAPRLADGPARPRQYAAELGIMTALYAASGLFGRDHPQAVLAAFLAIFAGRLALSRDRGMIASIALLLAVTGPAFESLAWSVGMFAYTQPDVIGVPWWLFAFYANGAWATRALGALLRTREPEPVAAA
jgi:hypothetical protein